MAKRKIPVMVMYSNVVCSGRRMSKDKRSDAVAITIRCNDTIVIIEVVCSKENGRETIERAELPFENVGLRLPLKSLQSTEVTANMANSNDYRVSVVDRSINCSSERSDALL